MVRYMLIKARVANIWRHDLNKRPFRHFSRTSTGNKRNKSTNLKQDTQPENKNCSNNND